MQNGSPPTVLEQNQTAFWQLKKQRRPVGAHSHRETRSYKGILLATLLRRLRWSSASTASSLSGRRFAVQTPLRVPGHDNAHRSTSASSTTDVGIVVVFCSREAVCFACQTWLDPPLKHLHAARVLRLSPRTANPAGLSCIIQFKTLCPYSQPHSYSRLHGIRD